MKAERESANQWRTQRDYRLTPQLLILIQII